jgi:hypothetical protein
MEFDDDAVGIGNLDVPAEVSFTGGSVLGPDVVERCGLAVRVIRGCEAVVARLT